MEMCESCANTAQQRSTGTKNCKHLGCSKYAGCFHEPNGANAKAAFLVSTRFTLDAETILARIVGLDLANHPENLAQVLALLAGLLGIKIEQHCKVVEYSKETGEPSKYGWKDLKPWDGRIGYDCLRLDLATFNALIALISLDQPVVLQASNQTFVVGKRLHYRGSDVNPYQLIHIQEARTL